MQHDERDYFLKADSDPGPGAIGAQADGGDSDDPRARLIEELAKHSKFTMDELREKDDEFLKKLLKSLDLDLDDAVDALNARVDALAAKLDQTDDLDDVFVDGAFNTLNEDDRDDDRLDGGLGDVQVGGAFTTADRRGN